MESSCRYLGKTECKTFHLLPRGPIFSDSSYSHLTNSYREPILKPMKHIIPLLIIFSLLISCTAGPENDFSDGTDPGEDISISRDLNIENNEISYLTSFAFDSTTRAIDATGVAEYLSYANEEGYAPVLFNTSSDWGKILIGASNVLEKITLYPVGDNCFLCVFDRLISIASDPNIIINRDPDGKIISISLSIESRAVDENKNIAFLNMETNKAYLLNPPVFSEDRHALNFLLSDGKEDSYGYSPDRVYLLADDDGLYTFKKDNPDGLFCVNNTHYDPLKENATLYTDDYVIYAEDIEEEGKESGKVTIFDSNIKVSRNKTEFSSDSPLSGAYFRVGNNIFSRELRRDDTKHKYYFTIYPLYISEELKISAGEGIEYFLADTGEIDGNNTIKNSSMSIYQNDSETLLIRAENVYKTPLLIAVTANEDGALDDPRPLFLQEGEKFPYPISSSTEFVNNCLYWVDDDFSKIYKADFSAGKIDELLPPHGLVSSDISITNNGEIIYHRFIEGTGNTVGTYLWNAETNEERLISYDEMKVYPIYPL